MKPPLSRQKRATVPGQSQPAYSHSAFGSGANVPVLTPAMPGEAFSSETLYATDLMPSEPSSQGRTEAGAMAAQ